MGERPIIIGLTPDGKVDTCCGRISRKLLIVVGFVLLSLLSFSLLITVIVQARNLAKVNNNSENNIIKTSTTATIPSTITATSTVTTSSISTTITTSTTTSTVIISTTTTNSNNNNTDEYCLEPGCLSAATQQLRFMDNTASATRCTDFYKYACGGWEQTHPIQSFDVERTILGDIINRRDADIERLLDSPIMRPGQRSWEVKVKTYYTECRDDYARVPESGKAMVGLIRDIDTINGWFLFDNSAENASQAFLLKNQTVLQQIAHIYGDLDAAVVFGLRTRFDEADSTVKRLEFFPSGLSMDVDDYLGNDAVSTERRSAYQTYILEVLALLAQDAGINDKNLDTRIVTIANDVQAIETALAENLRRNQANSNKPTSMTLKEMSDQYSFDFVELVSHRIGDPSIISGATSVYVINPMYFQEAFQLLAKNDEQLFARLIHNYMRWRLIRTYIEDLSYNYVHQHRVFLEKYYGYPIHSTNDAYCTREVIRRFPLAIQRLYTRNSTTHSDTVQTIQTLFNSLKDGFKQYINNQATWMADKTIAQQKIDAMTAAIGYASLAFDDTQLDSYYENFVVGVTSHFENAYGYHRFYGWTISNSLINPGELDHWDLFETRTSRLFDYIAIFNRLFVIASGMHEPIVNQDWPWAMNMGSIGVLLAQKLFTSIDGLEGRTHSANGTQISDWWSSSTANAYNTSRGCITDYYVRDVGTLSYNINGLDVLVQLAGEPFSPTTLRHIGALRFSYAALKQNDEMKLFKMPGTKLTGEQTFFLAYAQTQCYQRQDWSQFVATQSGVYDERTALNAALIHMPEFAEAFQCVPKENKCF